MSHMSLHLLDNVRKIKLIFNTFKLWDIRDIREPTSFLAKHKNEDSDLGWTADLNINLDIL